MYVAVFGGILAALGSVALCRWTPGALLCGVIPGTVSGLLAPTRRGAAWVAASSALIVATMHTLLPGTSSAPSLIGGILLFAGAVSAGPVGGWTWSLRRDRRARDRLVLGSIALSIAAMVPLSITQVGLAGSTGMPGSTTAQWMSTPVTSFAADADLYLRTYQLMKAGSGFYSAYENALMESHPERPINRSDVFGFRLPTMWWIWAAVPLPPVPTLLSVALLFGAAAVVTSWLLARMVVHPALALASSVCVAAWYARLAATPEVVFPEPYAGALVLAVVTLMVAHLREECGVSFLVPAVVLALLAALVREPAGIILACGLAYALAAALRRERPWIDVVIWVVGIACFAFLFFVHKSHLGAGLIRAERLATSAGPSALRFVRVGWSGDGFMDSLALLSPALVLATIAGICLLRRQTVRDWLLLAVVGSLVVFCVVGPVNRAFEPLGYWGNLVKPTLWALSPVAVSLLVRERRRVA
jgi:hypothetical protein